MFAAGIITGCVGADLIVKSTLGRTILSNFGKQRELKHCYPVPTGDVEGVDARTVMMLNTGNASDRAAAKQARRRGASLGPTSLPSRDQWLNQKQQQLLLPSKEALAVINKSEKLALPGAMGARPYDGNCSALEYSVPDDELEKRVAHVLIWNALVPPNTVGVKADRGRITLTGHVELEYQRSAAEAAVRPMCGVSAATNNITVGRNSFGSK